MTIPIEEVTKAFNNEHTAFMPYFTLGYPDYETSLDIIQSCAEAGADLMELGMPFSDPLADGPTIQNSTQVALNNGVDIEQCLQAVSDLRKRGITIPLMLMGYYNPILNYGEQRFVEKAKASGANGFIIPDLPPEEGASFEYHCINNKLALSYLLAPTSTEERIKLVSEKASGFVYLVSLTGVTGARIALPNYLQDFVVLVRRHVTNPLAIGFGISTPDQAQEVGKLVEGVIVGSKLINIAGDSANPAEACGQFVADMVLALKQDS
ncbi:MAG TPA: tryptophan synthase subunit alpha [Chloroflexi bacterium]|nr:tryptophan synthase subunit alpha [Chloroflexota bacterium]